MAKTSNDSAETKDEKIRADKFYADLYKQYGSNSAASNITATKSPNKNTDGCECCKK